MRAYAANVRRLLQLNRQFDVWLCSQSLWRLAPVYYGLIMLATYVGSWTINRPQQPGVATDFHLIFPAVMTGGQLLALRFRRRRLGLLPPRRSRADPGDK